MKLLISISFLLYSSITFASGNGGGGGPRPGMDIFRSNPKSIEAVKFLETRHGEIVFNYKPAGNLKIEKHSLRPLEISNDYLKALQKSYEEGQQWIHIDLDN